MPRLLLIMTIFSAACGGANNREVSDPASEGDDVEAKYTAADMIPRAVLDRAELTTAVDEKRFRAAAPIKNQFEPTDKVIYFVGKLKRVPTDATIEVRWFLDSDTRPMLVSDIQGSDTFQFAASFSPTEEQFFTGTYSARVFVNEQDVGGVSFTIGNPDPISNHALVSGIAFSTAVTGEMKPKRPSDKFKSGTDKLYVTFDVKGAEPDTVADIVWFRQEESFESSRIEISGNRRYGAHVESPGTLPDGEYHVEIHIGDKLTETDRILIGKKGGGPSIDEISLGLVLKDNNMPKKAMTVFQRDTSVIQCGLRFIDLLPGSVINVQWIQVEEDGDTVLFNNVSNLSTGGSGTMGAPWEPGYELSPGDYKAVVLVNDEALGEALFKVE